jgi:hypothetical protein
MDAGLASLPGRQTSGYDRTAQAIIAAGKRPDVDGHPECYRATWTTGALTSCGFAWPVTPVMPGAG